MNKSLQRAVERLAQAICNQVNGCDYAELPPDTQDKKRFADIVMAHVEPEFERLKTQNLRLIHDRALLIEEAETDEKQITLLTKRVEQLQARVDAVEAEFKIIDGIRVNESCSSHGGNVVVFYVGAECPLCNALDTVERLERELSEAQADRAEQVHDMARDHQKEIESADRIEAALRTELAAKDNEVRGVLQFSVPPDFRSVAKQDVFEPEDIYVSLPICVSKMAATIERLELELAAAISEGGAFAEKAFVEQSRLQQEIESLRTSLATAVEEQKTVQRWARDMEETVDNVRAALGLESTHWQVIADEVRIVRESRDKALGALAEIAKIRCGVPGHSVATGCRASSVANAILTEAGREQG